MGAAESGAILSMGVSVLLSLERGDQNEKKAIIHKEEIVILFSRGRECLVSVGWHRDLGFISAKTEFGSGLALSHFVLVSE